MELRISGKPAAQLFNFLLICHSVPLMISFIYKLNLRKVEHHMPN